MSDAREQPGNRPGPESLDGQSVEQTHGSVPYLPVDPSLENPGAHNTLATTAPIFNLPLHPLEATTASDNHHSNGQSTTQLPAATLNFTNEPFENDYAQQQWLRETIGDHYIMGEHQPTSGTSLQSEGTLNPSAIQQELNKPAASAEPTQDVSCQQAENHDTVDNSDANQVRPSGRISAVLPSSAAQHKVATTTAPTSQQDTIYVKSQPQTLQQKEASRVPQSEAKDRSSASHPQGMRLQDQGNAPSDRQASSGSNGNTSSSEAGLMSGASIQRPGVEAFYRRTCAYIGYTYQDTTKGIRMLGQTYVEKLEPLRKHCDIPLVLVHGDFHTSQIWLTKPDGNPGWASFFLNRGYEVYLIDLPPNGRSSWLDHEMAGDIPYARISVEFVESELTASSKKSVGSWPTAADHSEWPGTGLKGDPVFDRYFASLTPLFLARPERQVLARDALVQLLHKIGPSVLIGEGSGATAAWLAADLEPNHVVGVVAIEPPGPPFGTSLEVKEDGGRVYSENVKYREGVRPYGISDIPLGFHPPPNPELSLSLDHEDASQQSPLDVEYINAGDGHEIFLLQKTGIDSSTNDDGIEPVHIAPRQLVNLKKMKHAVFTAHASSHSMYDRATCLFLEQAGVKVRHFTLASAGILGNGHLMFLKKNSDRLAGMVNSCMKQIFPGFQLNRLGSAIHLPRYNERHQSMAVGSGTNQVRAPVPSNGIVKAAQRLNSGQSQPGVSKTAYRNDRMATSNPGTASKPLTQALPTRPSPSQTPKQRRMSINAGNELSQMQQQIQSEHFQRIHQPRVLQGSPQQYTAALARNPAMPSPSRLQAFATHMPEAIQVQMPQDRRPAYIGQRQQENGPLCITGALPCTAPACPIHGMSSSPRTARQSPRNQGQFVQDQMQNIVYPSLNAAALSTGPMPDMHVSHFSPRYQAQSFQEWQLPGQAVPQPTSQMGLMINQNGVNVRTPQRRMSQPSGNTTIAAQGMGWDLQSPTTPTPAPRATAVGSHPRVQAMPTKLPNVGGSATKKPKTKPKKTATELEEDDEYDPAAQSAKTTGAKARGGKGGASAKKGAKGKQAAAEDTSVAPGEKSGRATTAKKPKSTKRKSAGAAGVEGTDNEASVPDLLAQVDQTGNQKPSAAKRKRKATDEGDAEAESAANTTAGAPKKRGRTRAPARGGKGAGA